MGGPLRITFLCRSLSIGGAERQLVALANGLSERGHRIKIISFYRGGALEADLHPEIRIASLEKQGRYDVVTFSARLVRELRSDQPNIVYSYLTVANLLSLLGRRLGRPPSIIWGLRASDMRMDLYDRLSRATHRLEQALARMPDLTIVNSHLGRRVAIARGFQPDRLAVVPNGLDLVRFKPDEASRMRTRQALGVSGDEVLIGHVARLDPMKDHGTFLRALSILREWRADVRGLCATSAPPSERSVLKAQIASFGLADAVQVIEPGHATEGVYPAMDVFCSSSAFGEGFPNVVGEALACGVPTAVTDVGDSAWLVGSCGAVARPRDPEALARALAHVIDNRSQALSSAARSRAEYFSIDRMVDSTEDIMFRACRQS